MSPEDVETVRNLTAAFNGAETGIRGARLELIEGAGHSSPIEAPDEVTDAIERFLVSLN